MKDKVSVVVPIYNVDKYLSKCIESILNQDYKNIELILVNDGSPDDSQKIIEKYEKIDKRVISIKKKNGGVSSARNEGIKKATGDYICFVDGDDYVMHDYISYMLKLIKEQDADIALTTNMFSNFNLVQTKNEKCCIKNGEETTIDILCYKIPIGVYCKLFKANFIKSNNLMFEEKIYIGEGFNFNTSAFQKANKVAIGNRKIYFYRRDNSSSATTKFSLDKWNNGLFAIQNIKDNLIINSKRIENALKFANWRTVTDAFDILCLSGEKNKYKLQYKKWKKICRSGISISFKNPVAISQKIRAIIMFILPDIIPIILKLRRILFGVIIKRG